MIILRACLEFTTGEIIVGHFCTLPSFIGNPVLKKVGAIQGCTSSPAPPGKKEATPHPVKMTKTCGAQRGKVDPNLSEKYLPHSQICGPQNGLDHLLCLYLMTIPTNQRHKKISSRLEHPSVIFYHDHLVQLMINW